MDLEAHIHPILHDQSAAQDGKRHDSETALFERHSAHHGQSIRALLDLHRNSRSAMDACNQVPVASLRTPATEITA